MSFPKALISQFCWIALLGICNYFASQFYPQDGFSAQFSWLTYAFFSILTFSTVVFAKLLVMVNPKRNLTVVVFGILSARFLFTLFFFGIYFLLAKPEGKFFVLPFMVFFALFLLIENVYLLKYANYVYKNSKNTT